MVMNDTFYILLQRTRAAKYMATYLSNNRDRINGKRRERYRRGKLIKQQMTEEEKEKDKKLNYYYRNHEKCKAYARKYAKANYLKNRAKILNRKRVKRLSEKKVVIHPNTWQMIPLIVVSNAKPEDKLATIVHLL